jgi:hypothetical protein
MVVGDWLVNVAGRINWPPREMYHILDAPVFLVPGSNPTRWVNIAGWGYDNGSLQHGKARGGRSVRRQECAEQEELALGVY